MDMSPNKAVVRQWLQEEDNRLSLTTVDQLLEKWMTPDFKVYVPGTEAPLDRAGYRELSRSFAAGFSGFSHEIKQLVAEDDVVVAVITLRMKHTGTFEGLAATGRMISVNEILVVRIRDGKIAEERFVLDSAALERQITGGAASQTPTQ